MQSWCTTLQADVIREQQGNDKQGKAEHIGRVAGRGMRVWGRAGQGRAGRGRVGGLGQAWQMGAGLGRAEREGGLGRAEREGGQGRPGQILAGHGTARQDRVRQGRAGQGRAGHTGKAIVHAGSQHLEWIPGMPFEAPYPTSCAHLQGVTSPALSPPLTPHTLATGSTGISLKPTC